MSTISKIEWTDRTWNPVRGCSEVSEGCRNCYAMRQAHRFNQPGGAYEGLTRKTEHGPVWTGKVRLVESELDAPMRWTKPSRVFVNSMSDLFHKDLSDDDVAQVFRTIQKCLEYHKGHTFQILTKRPARMLGIINRIRATWGDARDETASRTYHPWPWRNVHLGVSVEDRKALGRLYQLWHTGAAAQFVSIEPLLEDLGDISYWLRGAVSSIDYHQRVGPNAIGAKDRLDWVIVGGESGPNARPCNIEWIRSIMRQCQAAGVPVFVKQLGAAYADPVNGTAGAGLHVDRDAIALVSRRLRDRKGGDPAEWPEDLRVRELPR